MKRVLCAVLAVLLFSAMLPMNASAVILDAKGNITLNIFYKKEALKDGKFTCIQVAEVIKEDGSFYFQSLLEPKTTYIEEKDFPDAEDVYDEIMDNKTFFRNNSVSHTNKTGIVYFKDLEPGLYLIIQEIACKGYTLMDPFLVSLPHLDPDGVYRYDVDASMKPELEHEPDPTVATTKPPQRLPQTGQLNWPIPVLASSGMMVFAIGWWLFFSGRKESYYET